MKKIIILLLTVLFCTALSSRSIFNHLIPSSISMSYNSINVEDGVKFYVLESEVYNENLYTRVKHTYTDSSTYKEHEYRVSYQYKFISGRARWQKNEFVDLNLYQLDLRGVWKDWSCGVLQAWDTAPQTYFVFGKEFKFNLDFFIIPGFLHTRSDFMTSDFKVWHYENTLKLKLRTEIKAIENLINAFSEKDTSLPAVFLKCQYRIKDYGKTISEMLFGFEVDF